MENADVAKEALASASSVRMRCDLDNVDASGNIYADEKAAAYMKNSGLFDQTWTISISGEEWFHMKIVTDEEINKMTNPLLPMHSMIRTTTCLAMHRSA